MRYGIIKISYNNDGQLLGCWLFFIWNEQEYRNTKLGAEDRCADILIHV